MSNRLIGYQSGQGFLYGLSGASKLIFFILVSVACMATYDPRFIFSSELIFDGKMFHLLLKSLEPLPSLT